MQLEIEQADNDNKRFVAKNDRTKRIFDMLGYSYLTIEDINEIKSIPIEFIFSYEEIPIGAGSLKITEGVATWYDKKRHQYFGRKLDKKGYLYNNETAVGRNADEVRDKLLGREEL